MATSDKTDVNLQLATISEETAVNIQDDIEFEEGVTNAHPVRLSSRERTLTEKGQKMHEEQVTKHEKAFTKAYTTWVQTARASRTALKTFCSAE